MGDKPDFEALRKLRNEAHEKLLLEICASHGWDRDKIHSSYDPDACYCACGSDGPCEHDWGGWREFPDGNGGEQFCSRCGMGAMSHGMMYGP